MMTKENATVQTPRVSFVQEFLEQLQSAEPRELVRIRDFFSEAFLLFTEEEYFDDGEYRTAWAWKINTINDLCRPMKELTDTQIDEEIDEALEVLKAHFNSRKEAQHV